MPAIVPFRLPTATAPFRLCAVLPTVHAFTTCNFAGCIYCIYIHSLCAILPVVRAPLAHNLAGCVRAVCVRSCRSMHGAYSSVVFSTTNPTANTKSAYNSVCRFAYNSACRFVWKSACKYTCKYVAHEETLDTKQGGSCRVPKICTPTRYSPFHASEWGGCLHRHSRYTCHAIYTLFTFMVAYLHCFLRTI